MMLFQIPSFTKKIVSALITIKQEKTSQGEKIKAKKAMRLNDAGICMRSLIY